MQVCRIAHAPREGPYEPASGSVGGEGDEGEQSGEEDVADEDEGEDGHGAGNIGARVKAAEPESPEPLGRVYPRRLNEG